jgi:hypothetical protein
MIPALLMRMSTGPTFATAALTAGPSLTSSWKFAPGAKSKETVSTPSRRNLATHAAPMPLSAPVTIAFLTADFLSVQ